MATPQRRPQGRPAPGRSPSRAVPDARRPRGRRAGAKGCRRPAASEPPLRAQRHAPAGGDRRPEMEGPAPARASSCTSRRLPQWLADKVELPYLHIDPFKIDFAAVTKMMSSAYAERYRILPVAITTREVTVATCEPYVREWEEQIRQVLRLEIKRVIANPARHPGLPGRVLQPGALGQGRDREGQGRDHATSPTSSSWCSSARSGKLDANDQHIVHICDWLFNYAFQERASDIHLEPRREVEQRALPHRRRAAPGLPDPDAGDGGDDEPHQGAGAHGRGGEAASAGRAAEDA